MPALSPQSGRWCANLPFPGGAQGRRDGHPVQRLRCGDDVLELGPTITVRRLWAACQLSPGLSISAPCHVRPAGLSSCRASCRCTCPTGASGTALPDVRQASPLEAPRHPVLFVALPATGLSQATGCCGHSPRSAALSRHKPPRLLGLIWCPQRPFGGTLRILGVQRQYPHCRRASASRARQPFGPSRLSLWKSGGAGTVRIDLAVIGSLLRPFPPCRRSRAPRPCSTALGCHKLAGRRSSAAGNAIAPAKPPGGVPSGPAPAGRRRPSGSPPPRR